MTKKIEKILENKTNTKLAVVEAAQAADVAAATFADCLLASTAYIAMAEKMPAIANKMDSMDRTLIVKTGEITNMAYDFVVAWHDLINLEGAGYALEKDAVRDYVYASAKRTGKASEVTSKIKKATGSFANKTTQAARDAMLAFKNVNECKLDKDGHLVAPNNVMRPLIDETVVEMNSEGEEVKVTYKDQPNTDSSFGSVPELKARIWAAASGITTKTGSKAGTGKSMSLIEIENAIELLAAGNIADHNIAEQEIIRRMSANLLSMVDELDCQDMDGNLDRALMESVQAARKAGADKAYQAAN